MGAPVEKRVEGVAAAADACCFPSLRGRGQPVYPREGPAGKNVTAAAKPSLGMGMEADADADAETEAEVDDGPPTTPPPPKMEDTL